MAKGERDLDNISDAEDADKDNTILGGETKTDVAIQMGAF